MAEYQSLLKKALFAACAVCCVLWSSPANAELSSNVPQEVRTFAETEAIAQLKQDMKPDPEKFGFANHEELGRAALGSGFPVYLVGPDDWEKALRDSPLSYAKPLDEWVFLVTVASEVKTYMTVTKKPNKLLVTGMGGRPSDLQGLNDYQSKQYPNPILLRNDRELHLAEGRGAPPSFWSSWMGRLIELTAVGALFFWIRNKKIKATDILFRQ